MSRSASLPGAGAAAASSENIVLFMLQANRFRPHCGPVAGGNEVHEIAKAAMLDQTRLAMHDHQPALIPIFCGSLSYSIFRKIEIVI